MTSAELRRVLVTGSRAWRDEAVIYRALEREWQGNGPFVLVHGAARGADSIAAHHQTINLRPVESHPVTSEDWAEHGPWAGPRRNLQMVEAGAEKVLAFIHYDHNGQPSRGASHCAKAAAEAGIPVEFFLERDEPTADQRHQLSDKGGNDT